MKLQLIATLLFLGISVCSKAQSFITLNKFEDTASSQTDTSTLNPSEREKWSNKIKPYFNASGKNLKAGQSVVSIKKPLQSSQFGNIDEKMCLLINKNVYVNTQPKIAYSSENIDLKMVYPRRNLVNPPKP